MLTVFTAYFAFALKPLNIDIKYLFSPTDQGD